MKLHMKHILAGPPTDSSTYTNAHLSIMKQANTMVMFIASRQS